MRPYLLAETNYHHLRDARIELAVLPWGATEAHNYHLPYATDVIEADHLAAESARICHERGGRVIVLPTVPFGVNTGQADISLDVNLNPSTQLAILADIVTMLDRQGIRKLLVFNSHGGNEFRPLLRELGLRFPRMFLAQVHWFRTVDKAGYFEQPGDHADEMETSLLLHLRPDLVLPRKQWGDGAAKQPRMAAFREGWAWAERRWSDVTADTGVGDPRAATAEKGAAYFKAVTERCGAMMYELCAADLANLYA